MQALIELHEQIRDLAQKHDNHLLRSYFELADQITEHDVRQYQQ